MEITAQLLNRATERKHERLTVDQKLERLAAQRQLARFRRGKLAELPMSTEIPF